MTQSITFEAAQSRYQDYVLPNGTHIALNTYLGKNLVLLASEGGDAPEAVGSLRCYPMAYLVEQGRDSEIQAHYHQADQFQLFVQGTGRIGTHPLSGLAIHYANALSPYGPIVAHHEGLEYVTFRNRWDPGAQWMPGAAQRLRETPGRRYFAASHDFELPSEALEGPTVWQELVSEMLPGLGAWLVMLGPDEAFQGRSPLLGAGQFLYVLRGGIDDGNQTLPAQSVIFVEPQEKAASLVAGAQGAALVVMQFPRTA
ncbi:hypothetical protein [Pseudorhodoferax soli]|uniref:Pirin N-terminal domain-containing protein n=1 Tax=Pseudorhodoferax soli TaxID=545864 RepID=A0A368XN56_9BURK|nr:hypothetical protein [Pseudorhodoferax soli]RCW68606.1 hypothetical protein DES41_107127 [Pseudorhodoferax soli]